MKNISLLVLIPFVFAMSGCEQKQQTKPLPTQKTAQADLNGDYSGTAPADTCGLYSFKVTVKDGNVTGSANGEKDVKCTLTLTGELNDDGKITGDAGGIDTLISGAGKFEWYYTGVFSGTLSKDSGNIEVILNTAGHSCPPKIPCIDVGKKLNADLRRM